MRKEENATTLKVVKPRAVEKEKTFTLTETREREVEAEIRLAYEEIEGRENCLEHAEVHRAVGHARPVVCDFDALRPVDMVGAEVHKR